MKGPKYLLIAFLMVAFSASFAFASIPADSSISAQPDHEIVKEIVKHFRSKVGQGYAFNNVTVTSKAGNVVLSGQVRDAYIKDRAEQAATEVSGVRTILNEIQVLPVSAFDDHLRLVIYRRLSHDGALFHYFVGKDPAINIIVNGSRVTLVGVVNSRVDKVRAISRVRELSGVLSVRDQLVVHRG
jgi:hypothetical protein